MNTRLRARRPGHASVDPWDASTSHGRRATPLRWLLPLCFALVCAAVAAGLWLRVPEEAPLEAIVALALLVPAVLLPAHLMGRQRRRVRNTLRRFSDDLEPERWRDAVRQLRENRLGAPSAFDALASGVETVLGEAERRWQALAELSADWYWETDRQHRLSWLSGGAPQALAPGLDDAALLGRRFDQIGVFRAPERGWAALHGSMTRLEAFRDVEFQVGVLPRPLRWISISGRPRHDAQGAVIGYEGVGRDITERRQAHEQLIASEQRWSTMTRLAADWYWQTDVEHRLLPLSAEQQQRIGADLTERLEGHTRWDAHRASLTPEQWAEHRADLDARRPFRSLQLEIEAGDGRWLWISISGMPRFDASGRFVGYHGVGRDITARQQAQALLLRHNEALQRAVDERTRDLQQINLDLDAFARQLAHELRTPIGQVQGLAQMLAERAAQRLLSPRTRSCCSCRCMRPSACAGRSMRCWRWPARRCSRCRWQRWT
jgi:PAS domain S-box-containing protein